MESTERLVRTWMGSGRESEIQETASGISNGQITLLNVVKALGEYLTADEDVLRTKGVEFLSLVLKICPPQKLSRQTANVLVTFYCGKLDDTETIIPALQGLVVLVSLPNFLSSDVEDVIRALFFHVKMRAINASQRFLVFSTIDAIMDRHRDALKNMGREFVSGYITIAEGEKDPRNLLTAFAIARVLLIEFNTADMVEALFNITFCYFPISFRPPPDDPYGISAEQLKSALRACIAATPLFGPMAIPVFLEKLLAGSPVSKRDTLQTMSLALPIYGQVLAQESARKLWGSLKLEIFQPTDPVTEMQALETTQVLIRTIYADLLQESGGSKSDMKGLAREACEECIKILQEPEKSQAKHAIKVLCAFLSTTPSVSQYTLSEVVPHLVKLYLDPDEMSNRPPITVLLVEIVTAASVKHFHGGANQPLMPYKDEIMSVFTIGLKVASTCQPALLGLRAMVNTPELLTDDELGFIVHNISPILQNSPDAMDDASSDTLELLSNVSSINPRHVEEQTLPLLFSSLPDQAPDRAAHGERSKYQRTLLALSKLCVPAELFETLVIRLTTKLDLIYAQKHESDTEVTAAYTHAIILTLSNTLEAKAELKHTDILKYLDRLVFRLYHLLIHASLVCPEGQQSITDSRVVGVAGKVIILVVRTLSAQRQEIFVAGLFNAFLQGNIQSIAQGHQQIPETMMFEPFKVAASMAQRNLVALFAAGLIPLHREVPLPVESTHAFLKTVIDWNSPEANAIQQASAWDTITSVVNKKAEDLTAFFFEMKEVYWPQLILQCSKGSNERIHAIRTWSKISNALLVRGYPSSSDFVEYLFRLVKDSDVGWIAGRAIGDIGRADKILTKKNNAICKVFQAQKYCNTMMPRILQVAQTPSDSQERTAYLVALISLLKSMPQSAYAHEMPALMPLLLRGLELPDTDIRISVIDTLYSALTGDSSEQSLISEHASTLVSAMLKNSVPSEVSPVNVRIAAVRYLGIIPTVVRYDVLHPSKPTVLRELSKVLDDPKRLVRKEAVDARTTWFNYSG